MKSLTNRAALTISCKQHHLSAWAASSSEKITVRCFQYSAAQDLTLLPGAPLNRHKIKSCATEYWKQRKLSSLKMRRLMQRDDVVLQDIVNAARLVRDFIQGSEKESFIIWLENSLGCFVSDNSDWRSSKKTLKRFSRQAHRNSLGTDYRNAR